MKLSSWLCLLCVLLVFGTFGLSPLAAQTAILPVPRVDPAPGRSDPALLDMAQAVLRERQGLIHALLTNASSYMEVYQKDAAAMNAFAHKHGTLDAQEVAQDQELGKEAGLNGTSARETILLLGKLRAVEAIPFLVKNLAFTPEGEWAWMRQTYPCVGALIDIGSPALRPMLAAVENTDDEKVRLLTSWAFINIIRRDAALAYIQSQTPANLSAVQQARVDALVKQISKNADVLLN